MAQNILLSAKNTIRSITSFVKTNHLCHSASPTVRVRTYYSYCNEPTHPIPNKQPKWLSAEEALKVVKSDDHVFIHGTASTPLKLVPALVEHGKSANLKNVRVHHFRTEGPAGYNAPECKDIFRSNSLFTGANCRQAVNSGRADFTPIHLCDMPQVFYKGIIKPDVALLQVTPADKHGFHSLGTSIDCVRAAIQNTKYIIGQVNPRLPRTSGHAIVHTSHFDVLVEGEMELPELHIKELIDADLQIGKLIAENLVEDGSTLQTGIGAIPSAVLVGLTQHKDLGLHTEMFSDGIVDLYNLGVITNRHKKLQTGRMVATFTLGTRKLFDFMDDNPYLQMMACDYVNHEFNIAQNPKVAAINACIEIDLFGQVCADSIGANIYSGFGGQVDFLRGAANALDGKGKPIIALHSVTNKGESKVVSFLKEGASVVTTRAHTHYVVTEYGITNLFGKNYRQRAYDMIRLAHPNHRAALEEAAFKRLKCMPSPD